MPIFSECSHNLHIYVIYIYVCNEYCIFVYHIFNSLKYFIKIYTHLFPKIHMPFTDIPLYQVCNFCSCTFFPIYIYISSESLNVLL